MNSFPKKRTVRPVNFLFQNSVCNQQARYEHNKYSVACRFPLIGNRRWSSVVDSFGKRAPTASRYCQLEMVKGNIWQVIHIIWICNKVTDATSGASIYTEGINGVFSINCTVQLLLCIFVPSRDSKSVSSGWPWEWRRLFGNVVAYWRWSYGVYCSGSGLRYRTASALIVFSLNVGYW